MLARIKNTSFSVIKCTTAVLLLKETSLSFVGPLIFNHVTSNKIILSIKSWIHFKGYIYFSYNQIKYGVVTHKVELLESATIDIIANTFIAFFFTPSDDTSCTLLQCVLQYTKVNKRRSLSSTQDLALHYKKYSIKVENNTGEVFFSEKRATSHCDWDDESVYKYTDPHEINQHIIKYVNNSFRITDKIKSVCYCTDDQHFNCTKDELGPVYLGQAYQLSLISNIPDCIESPVIIQITEAPNRACKSYNIKNSFQLFQKHCTKIDYNVRYSNNAKSCELFLHGAILVQSAKVTFTSNFFDVFRIMILPCPVGFVYDELTQMCQCDPVLTVVSVCNIGDQTILRSASSWIVGSTNEQDHHTYQVSSQCPFDYCLPHSSHLNLSNPDSQCQL